ncbi:MAG: ABC transporter ATP-binding protein/permease [Cyanobacteria bacterium]|nr:ABC transporter ATP-binding protein/permease [Cyanobacteriota bacterium]
MAVSSSALRRLITYGRPYRRETAWAIAASILNKIFDLAPPILIGMAVDIIVQKDESLLGSWGIVGIERQFIILSILTFLIWSLESVFEYAYKRLWRNLAQAMQHHLRLDTYAHLQDLDLEFFEERSSGDLLSVLNDDINQLERFLDTGANDILQVVTTVLAIGGVFFAVAPQVAWMSMLPMPFILWGSIAFQKTLAPRYGDMRAKVGWLSARLANNLGGITTIKSYVAEAHERDRVAADSEAYRQSNRRAITLSAAFVPLIRIVILVGFTATLLYGGLETARGAIAVGTYSVMVFITQRLLWPLTSLGQTLDNYQRAMASTRRVFGLLDTPIAAHPGDRLLNPDQVRGAIALNNVEFGYRDRPPVLRGLSLEIPAGQTIAIVGATGSGKSTVVKLLLRLYEIQGGSITLDGMDIREVELRSLRRQIGWVSQEVFLFHGTVAENIAYGSFDAPREQIIEAAKLAEAHDFITQLPQGYDTLVGERGQKLSGGQRQRLAIARAILKDPPILILDEATSAVDNETEAAIQRSLDRITAHRTTIAIAHRLSTIRNADCIYVMDRGAIVEAGTHDQLLAQRGLYETLWRVQTGTLTASHP